MATTEIKAYKVVSESNHHVEIVYQKGNVSITRHARKAGNKYVWMHQDALSGDVTVEEFV